MPFSRTAQEGGACSRGLVWGQAGRPLEMVVLLYRRNPVDQWTAPAWQWLADGQ